MTGGVCRVKVANVLVALPAALEKTARYLLPLLASAAVKAYVSDVAPAMLAKRLPPLVLICHCTVGVGLPLAMAVKVIEWPAGAAASNGLVVTTGAVCTVSGAGVVVATPRDRKSVVEGKRVDLC